MKLKMTKTASGKKVVKISKKEWLSIGEKAGWLRGNTKTANQQWEARQNMEKAYELRDKILGWVSAQRWGSKNLSGENADVKLRIHSELSYGINNAHDMAGRVRAANVAADGFFELGYNNEGKLSQLIAQGMMGKKIGNPSWSPPQQQQQQ